ncbi:MAG: bifunctional aldolase/short-chain dehydrogenase [Rhodospirillales bacterium]|nr:bifunctional aldolase/short-chain dehydrogenase [Rhodospirillales bacterium]
MKNLWSDRDAEAMVGRYAGQGVNRDLALRVYTSRLLGGEPKLVQHGGGNTSVKTRVTDATGREVEVLCVKGSGWDMAAIEPAGLPAVRLKPLLDLVELPALDDADMVNLQRANLLDSAAPNPSVETLLHAFLPHKFIDHTHANAVLAVTDQPDGAAIAADIFGDRVALVPYVMPGFALAKAADRAFRDHPNVEGLILLKHGIFSFGATADEAYGRMIDLVSQAEARIAKGRRPTIAIAAPPPPVAAGEIAPILRGLVASSVDAAQRRTARFVLEHRGGPTVFNFVNGAEVGRYSQAGTVTPDHVIRIKPKPLVLPAPEAGNLDAFRAAARAALAGYQAEYQAYFTRNNARQPKPKTELDPLPRLILVQGVGLFGLGASAKDARVAADIAETNVEVIAAAETIGRFESIPEADIFDMEYWSLEQAKLGKGSEKRLARHVVAITGGASGIGRATALAFGRDGAEVAVLDRDEAGAAAVAKMVGGIGLGCDVTKPDDVAQAFARIAATYGGLDIVVSNAGAAWQGRIGEVDDAILRQSFELNFFAHQAVAQAAVRILKAQGLGGTLLFNVSKQAVNPGPDFGPYGIPKAATLALMRQYALDYGAIGVRANAVNADRIQSGLLTPAMIATRAKARGVTETDYMSGNLLGVEVTADDVAKAFVDLALSPKTTAAVVTVDGGNIAAALR